MELEKISLPGVDNIYALSAVKKEFRKAADEPWKDNPPWKRYQQKLVVDLAVLGQELENAVELQFFEKITGVERLYSIRHSETKKNLRILYTIENGSVILLVAFLEKNKNDYTRAIETAQKRLHWLDN